MFLIDVVKPFTSQHRNFDSKEFVKECLLAKNALDLRKSKGRNMFQK